MGLVSIRAFLAGGMILAASAPVTGQDVPLQHISQPEAPTAMPISLAYAQARAAGVSKMAELAKLNGQAAKLHRQAAQSDYFPKIGSTFTNLHFNKFMGQEIEVRALGRVAEFPLLNKDQSLVAVTATQPVTPLLKIREVVRIARADERTAQAKADAAAALTAANVEQNYLTLLVAERQRAAAEIKLQMSNPRIQIASLSVPAVVPSMTEDVSILEARNALVTASTRVVELTQSLDALMGLPADTQLDLEPPPPMLETISAGAPAQSSIEQNPEVVEAQQSLVKARAAAQLSKLDYVPDVAGMWGYAFQTAIPLLPRDFSFFGVVATWNVFDFGKRERSIRERSTQVRMAEANVELVRAKVAMSAQKAMLDLQRARKIMELTRQVASLYRSQPAAFQPVSLEAKAARVQLEIDEFQAELDYRLAYAELKRTAGGIR
jgi:outer membrane protein TolC